MESNPHIVQEIRRLEEQFSFRPDSLVFGRLADLHRKAGDPERALQILEEGLERHPRYLSAHIVRGRCLQALGRTERAREAFERVLRLDGQNPVALRSLAELARDRGEPEEARRHLEALLQVDPGNEEARAMLEDLEASAGGDAPTGDGAGASAGGEDPAGAGPEEASQLREQLRELDLSGPSAPEAEEGDLATQTLAGLYETQGFYREAVQMYERLLEERPASPEIRERLERARRALEESAGSFAQAAEAPVDSGTVDGDEPAGEEPEAPDRAEPEPSDAAEPEPSAATGSDGPPRAEGRSRPSAAEHLRALLRGEAGGDDGRPGPGHAP